MNPILFRPVVDSTIIPARMLISPTSTPSESSLVRGMDPLQSGVSSAHYCLSKIIPAVPQMLNMYLVDISSQHAEICHSGHVLERKLSGARPLGEFDLTRQCSWWNTDTMASWSGKDCWKPSEYLSGSDDSFWTLTKPLPSKYWPC